MGTMRISEDGRFEVTDGPMPVGTKAAHYGWIERVGGRGRRRSVHKTEIRVDLTYQRNTSLGKARDIASDWSWPAFGEILISDRGDKGFWVVDGAHRVGAAMLRSDITTLPSLVFRQMSIQEEAAVFTIINKSRRSPRGTEVWKAMVVAKDPDTLAAQDLLDSHGYTIGKRRSVADEDGSITGAAQTIRNIYRQGRLASVLDFIEALWPGEPQRAISGVLHATDVVVRRLMAAGKDPASTKTLARFKAARFQKLYRRGSYLCDVGRQAFHMGFTVALVEQYNRGLKANSKLPVGDSQYTVLAKTQPAP